MGYCIISSKMNVTGNYIVICLLKRKKVCCRPTAAFCVFLMYFELFPTWTGPKAAHRYSTKLYISSFENKSYLFQQSQCRYLSYFVCLIYLPYHTITTNHYVSVVLNISTFLLYKYEVFKLVDDILNVSLSLLFLPVSNRVDN